ncbi:hypothetical protein EJ08DRAFT_676612 [Tothia fuscella]|uniref:BTB domain-containing protein n=1 Tax=Tothia fuscella TaxID=1048955 RepID=A0A9P4U2D3_9PEZI|nr:hypothetical protein EJ08DRAFT_676612 [Tothia fuscella]
MDSYIDMAEYPAKKHPALDLDLDQFPYFDDGDVVVSMSPTETRPMVLHSKILATYCGYFKEKLENHIMLVEMVHSTGLPGLGVAATAAVSVQYVLEWQDCTGNGDGIDEGGHTFVAKQQTAIPFSERRYRPSNAVRRAYFLVFALIYTDYTRTPFDMIHNFPGLENTHTFDGIFQILRNYECTLPSSPTFCRNFTARMLQATNWRFAATAVLARPWHVIPLASLLKDENLYQMAFQAGVWYQFKSLYGSTAATKKDIVQYLNREGELCRSTGQAINQTLDRLTTALRDTADRLGSIDMTGFSGVTRNLWGYYIDDIITPKGYYERDLDLYRDLFKEDITAGTVISYYKIAFAREGELFLSEGFFVVRRELRKLLVKAKSCVESLFVGRGGQELGAMRVNPLWRVFKDQKVEYPWVGKEVWPPKNKEVKLEDDEDEDVYDINSVWETLDNSTNEGTKNIKKEKE